MNLRLTNVLVERPDGAHRVDVRLRDGLIEAVGVGGDQPGDEVVDLTGYLLLPAPAEPHAHLDKALLGDRLPNPRGDLAGAIEAMHAAAPTLTDDDLVDRAVRAALLAVAHGTTAIRTHADVGGHAMLRHVEALAQVKAELQDVVQLQIVALVAAPTTGLAGAQNAGLAREALQAGADLLGGVPHLDPDPVLAMQELLELAAEFAVPVDLHTDETLAVDVLGLEQLATHVLASGFPHRVTASHCVSLGMQPPDVAARVAAAVAEAGIGVVALPQTNLFLQGREIRTATPRGLTALRTLLDAGVRVAGGGDNVRDPFNSMGRADAFETASLLVTAGHLSPAEALDAITAGARAVMGLPVTQLRAGAPAELVAVRAGSSVEAIASGTQDRVVFHRGRIVARTRVERTFPTRPGGSLGELTTSFHVPNTHP